MPLSVEQLTALPSATSTTFIIHISGDELELKSPTVLVPLISDSFVGVQFLVSREMYNGIAGPLFATYAEARVVTKTPSRWAFTVGIQLHDESPVDWFDWESTSPEMDGFLLGMSPKSFIVSLIPTQSTFPLLTSPLLNILGNEEYSDFRIRVGSTEFPVVRAILAAHSEYFAALFSSPMLEKHQKFCKLDDVDPAAFAQLLRFCYGDDVESTKSLPELFILADRFQMDTLKEKCEHLLQQMISTENAEDISRLAFNANGSDSFCRIIMQFIMENCMQQ